MFAIDNRNIKLELKNKLINDKKLLFKSLEDIISNIYENNINKYGELIYKLENKLTTPEEVVQMEKTKQNISLDLININRDFDDANKIFLFLIKSNDIFSEELIKKTSEGINRYNKFKIESEKLEKMHRDNRENLENKFKKERKEIENEIIEYINNINSLDNATHINEYENVCATINYLEENIPKMQIKIDRTLLDEKLLFDDVNENFENFNRSKNKLNKLGILWRNIKIFYEQRKIVIHNFSENVDIEHYIRIFSEIESEVNNNKKDLNKEEEIIGKMSRILEDDIENIINFLNIMNRIFESSYMTEDLRKDVLETLENKAFDQSCREILFSYFSKKDY